MHSKGAYRILFDTLNTLNAPQTHERLTVLIRV
jgi:hypothetical protein